MEEEDPFGLRAIQNSHVEKYSRYQTEDTETNRNGNEDSAENETLIQTDDERKRKEPSGSSSLLSSPSNSKRTALDTSSSSSSSTPLPSSSSMITSDAQRAIFKTPAMAFPLVPSYESDDDGDETEHSLFEKSLKNVLEKEKEKETKPKSSR